MKKHGIYRIGYFLFIVLFMISCATDDSDNNDSKFVELTDQVDVDILDARQEENALFFTIKVDPDSDRCDFVDTEVDVKINIALSDPENPGEEVTLSFNMGRIKRGHDKNTEFELSTAERQYIPESITAVAIRARLQNCTLDPFIP
ncbi:MAG: hypothetical protein HQM14_00695 [SAR324 cluster bacterium]|nr:hypothetical protein [SAR324 cluster bacterium]